MTDLEQKIIDLIEGNSHLSNDLKKRYILALFDFFGVFGVMFPAMSASRHHVTVHLLIKS